MKMITPHTRHQRKIMRRYNRHALRRTLGAILRAMSLGDLGQFDNLSERV